MSQQTTSNSLRAATIKAALLSILCEYNINRFSMEFTMPDGECLKCNQKASLNNNFEYAMFAECSVMVKKILAQNNITKFYLTVTPFDALTFEIKPNPLEQVLEVIGQGGVTHFEQGHFA